MLEHVWVVGQIDVCDRLVETITNKMNDVQVSPSEAVWALIQIGYLYCHRASYEISMARFDKACEVARSNGLQAMLHRALLARFMVEFRVCGWDVANATLRETEGLVPPNTRSAQGFLNVYRARRAQSLGRFEEAADLMEISYDSILRTQSPYLACTWAGFTSEVLAQAGKTVESARVLEGAWEVAEKSTLLGWYTAQLTFAGAYLALCEGKPQRVRTSLRLALSEARNGNHQFSLRYLETAMPVLFSLAIEENIDGDFVRHLIRLFRLKPPLAAPDRWPWPIRILTLGRFEVQIDDKPLEFPRKTPKKTLALLKALLTHSGDGVPDQWLCDALWGDEQADAAREALSITVLRLRKLLGVSDAVVHKGGCVTLSRSLVWVDSWRFEARAAQPDGAGARQELDLYRGAFLPADEGEAWTVSLRERLRGKFIHLLASHGAALAGTGDFEQALGWYFSGIDADPIVEAFHQGLMRCYQKSGRHTEAISTYRRLRQTLSAVLGVTPSAGSRKLYEISMQACGDRIEAR